MLPKPAWARQHDEPPDPIQAHALSHVAPRFQTEEFTLCFRARGFGNTGNRPIVSNQLDLIRIQARDFNKIMVIAFDRLVGAVAFLIF